MKTFLHDFIDWFLHQHSWVQHTISFIFIMLGILSADGWPTKAIGAIVICIMLLVIAEFVDPDAPW